MKSLLTFYLIISFGNGFAQKPQKINSSAVCDSTVWNLLDEFSKNRVYTPEEARETGIQKANCDIADGTKKIIVYIGMFTYNYCLQCFYSDLGFIIEKQVSSDVIYERDYSYEFANGYNDRMNSLLDSVQLSELKKLSSDKDSDVFIFDVISKSRFIGSKINDTLIHIQLKNEELEKLFPSDLSHIKVIFKKSVNDPSKEVYTYSRLMLEGIEWPITDSSKIVISYNFDEVEDRMKICWCKFIEKEFQRIVKITFK